MKKIFHKIHLWLSVPFGLIITIICFSGAMLVFENEVMQWCRPGLYRVEAAGRTSLPVDRLVSRVTETLPDSISVTGVNISSDPSRAYQVSLSKPRRSSVYIDQYSGEIKGRYERTPFFTTMFKLHRWLLDSMKPDGGIFIGKIIVGISTLIFVFVLISGVFIWWPRTRKTLKNKLAITARKGWRRFCYDLHAAGGMYALLFLLAMALTGLTWSFSWYRTGFYKVFGAEIQQPAGHAHTASKTQHGNHKGGNSSHSPFVHWQKVYEQLKSENPAYRQISLSQGSASVSLSGWGNQRAADLYTFNPRNGEITAASLYKDMDVSRKIRGWIFSVHVGSWGGLLTRIFSFIAALLGATLPLTGYYLWIKRTIISSRKRDRNPLNRDCC